jgi:hypothetical protein
MREGIIPLLFVELKSHLVPRGGIDLYSSSFVDVFVLLMVLPFCKINFYL